MGGEDDTGPVKLSRLAAAGGIAGPVLFTVAWVVSSLRQAGHSAVEVSSAAWPRRMPGIRGS
jgi:hypothetical protein